MEATTSIRKGKHDKEVDQSVAELMCKLLNWI